jgi:Prolipoprotein diacylglyceryl transferase
MCACGAEDAVAGVRGVARLASFRAFGYLGLAAATGVALAVSATNGGSVSIELTIVATSVVVFLAVAQLERALRGYETLVYYHHAVPVLAVAGFLAWALGAPPLRQLDATVLGLGAFLACGRIGCFLAGCCYGRCWRHGVARRENQLPPGFPEYLVGQRLVAVQLVEAALVLGLVVVGIAVSDRAAGSAFAVYVAGYAMVRFWLEELRGDPVRPYWRGLSEAQWTSLVIAGGAAAAARLGALPLSSLLAVLGASLLLAWPVVLALRRRSSALLHPAHVREIARAVPEPAAGRPRVRQTSQGLRISGARADATVTYTLSSSRAPLQARDAIELAGLIRWMRHGGDEAVLIPGVAGAYHVVIEPRRVMRPATRCSSAG